LAEKYLGVEKYIFADVYNFFLKYKDIPDNDYYWQCCVNEAKQISMKYKNYPLAMNMINNVLEQLEFKRSSKNIILGGNTYKEWEIILGDYRNT
jgi:hypothetical protein